MIDYRLPENRLEYFKALYSMNLEYKAHPGLVYLYMPALKKYYDWTDEQALWFATINGHTQHPITSLKIMQFMPSIPESKEEWKAAHIKFNEDWASLSFDSDRNKQKKDTLKGLYSYSELVKQNGSQVKLWSDTNYDSLWSKANSIVSFGRLSTFSYLEYIKINGFGADCTTLMFNDFDGSRSHRNGMLFLLGYDKFVFDKRQLNSHSGKYEQFEEMCTHLENEATEILKTIPANPDLGRFTFESCLCQFKNGFFSRRYPGVYADMGWDRIKWYDSRGFEEFTEPFKSIRAQYLPDWLREECEKTITPRAVKASMFAETGIPFRAEHILKNEK